MSNVTLRAFSSETQAKEYFNNKVVEATGVDGVLIKSASEIVFRKDSDGYVDLTEGSRCYLVISYLHGTSIQIDSGTEPESDSDDSDIGGDGIDGETTGGD